MTTFIIPVLFLSMIVSQRGEVAPAPPKHVVNVMSMKACQQCRLQEHDCARAREYDFAYTKDPKKWTQFVHDRLAAGETFPFLIWSGKDGKQFYMHGAEWVSFEDFVRRHDKSLK